MHKLKKARLAARMTQAELAHSASVSAGTVSYVERGVVPSDRVQKRLAAALDIDPNQLWGRR